MKEFENMFLIRIRSKTDTIGLEVGLERKMPSDREELDIIHAMGTRALMSFCAAVNFSCPACLAEELKHFIKNGQQAVKDGTPDGDNFRKSISHTALMALALATLVHGLPQEVNEVFEVDLDFIADIEHGGICLQDEAPEVAHLH